MLSNNTLCINKWFTIPLFNHIGAKKLLNPVNIKFLFCFQTGRQEESKSYLVITCTFFFIHIHTFIYGKKIYILMVDTEDYQADLITVIIVSLKMTSKHH